MKKKGFTLIELLAVIIIIALIALIAIPLIGNVIEKSKIGALENSVNGLVESANMYYANQSIKGEQVTETIFDFTNGEQTSTEKLEYKGKVYNGKLILHANGEVAVCIDDKEHYAYKNKDSDEIISGVGTCLYDGTTGDFSSNSSINDLRGKTVVATNIEESDDGLSKLITIPEEGHYDETSKISVANSDLMSFSHVAEQKPFRDDNKYTFTEDGIFIINYSVGNNTSFSIENYNFILSSGDILYSKSSTQSSSSYSFKTATAIAIVKVPQNATIYFDYPSSASIANITKIG